MENAEYLKLADAEDRMWYFRALHGRAADLLRKFVPRAEGSLLDAGCGTGGFLRRAAGWFPELRCSGVDLYEVACDLARDRGTPRVVRASVTDLPVRSGCTMAVTSLDVLQHIPLQERAVEEMFRVLEPGGIAVVNAPAYEWLWSYHDVSTHTERRYTRPRLLKLLAGAGFLPLSATYWNFLPLPIVIAKRKVFPRLGGEDDVRVYPPIAERVLDAAMALERRWTNAVSPLPAGSSVLVAVRKPH